MKSLQPGIFAYILLGMLLLSISLATTQTQAQVQGPSGTRNPTELELIARLNTWRLKENLMPLRINPVLNSLAARQVEFLMTQNSIETASIHVGSRGELPPQRAQSSPFNWPVYGTRDQINIGEIAAIGTVESAVGFWSGSDVHRRTVTNGSYHEVGIASAKRSNGTLFIVVFGSRPNILPALVNPLTQSIYLSNESYRWAQATTAIKQANTIQIFDELGRPLTRAAIPWQPEISLPQGLGERLFILTSDGSNSIMTEIRLTQDLVVLPDTLQQIRSNPSPTASTRQTAALAATPVPSTTPTQQVSGFLATNTPAGIVSSPVPSATAMPSATTAPASRVANLRLVYDSRSLSIINISSGPLDISQLSIGNAERRLESSRWGRVNSSLNLTRMPNGYCLQVWPWTVSSAPRPEACRLVAAAINIDPAQTFWLTGSFDIRRNGEILATCKPDAGLCEASLPVQP